MKKSIELETGEKIIIRHVTQRDINGVWNNFNDVIEEGIYLPVFFPVRSSLEKESWYRKIKEEKELCIVADNQKSRPPFNIIGQCEISNSPWDAGLHVGILGIIIKSDYRDLGIGTHLIDTAIRESQKLNSKEKIILSCFSTNERALHLYRKLGFETVGVRKKQFYMDSKYYDEVLMELWIDDYLKES
ncbi:MAG: GNAT family N-acetyltransferase [Promethearchaeota archaeon]